MTAKKTSKSIPKSVKTEVAKRDNYQCILCGSPEGLPNAHCVAKSQGGLAIVENIVTLCQQCHYDTDKTPKRKRNIEKIKVYLNIHYPDWKETDMINRK